MVIGEFIDKGRKVHEVMMENIWGIEAIRDIKL